MLEAGDESIEGTNDLYSKLTLSYPFQTARF